MNEKKRGAEKVYGKISAKISTLCVLKNSAMEIHNASFAVEKQREAK